MTRIELNTHIRAPRERCFDLSRSVELHTRSTAATGETAVGGRTSGLLEQGRNREIKAVAESETWRTFV